MEQRPRSSPSHIGRFQVEALLGSGEYLLRLQREAQACARLQHPHIVTVYEAGEIDGVVYIAMEFLEREDLAAAWRGEVHQKQL